MSVPKTRPDVSEDAPADDAHAPRPLTLAENIVAHAQSSRRGGPARRRAVGRQALDGGYR